jgi:hypothetical protein
MLATTIHKSNTTPHHQVERKQTHSPNRRSQRGCAFTGFPHRGRSERGPVASKPNSVSGSRPFPKGKEPKSVCCCTRPPPTTGKRAIQRFVWISVIRTMRAGPEHVVLLRKEVIQPHLPVRLPCYDFVPIADPTFDGSLHKG